MQSNSGMEPVVRINLWSGPRNISTAMMYSFAQRNDTLVVDEPLYPHYLCVSGAAHPGREEVLAAQENNGQKVVEWMMSHAFEKPVVFFKQMTHHLLDLPLEFLADCRNIILIRNPKDVLISYAKVIAEPELAGIGIKQSYDLLQFLQEKKFHGVVVDSADVLKNPETLLKKLCENLGIRFQPTMLHWQVGPRPEDGVWAKHWYSNVHQSTGFAPWTGEEKILPEQLKKIYEEAKPFYDSLREQALKS